MTMVRLRDTICTFPRECSSLRRTISCRRTARTVLAKLSAVTERPMIIPHDDHGAPAAARRPPASGSRPTDRGCDPRHRSRGPSLDRPGVAQPSTEGRDKPGRDGPDGIGTPARSRGTSATREEAHGAPSAHPRPASKLGIHVDARASARRPRQDPGPASRGSGPRVCSVAGAPAVSAIVAKSVLCLAPASARMCA